MHDSLIKKALSRLRVLVVDDHEINRQFLLAGLKNCTGLVDLAASGRQAIERCRNQEYDLILMDLHMPHMDGLATAAQIRSLEAAAAEATIVFLTADTRGEERQRIAEAGFGFVLTKPVALPDLKEAMAKVVLSPEDVHAGGLEGDCRGRLIDQEGALRVCNQDPRLVRDMQTLLVKELKLEWPALERAVSRGDRSAAADLLHRWAGAAGYAGAQCLAEDSRALRACLVDESSSQRPGSAFVCLLRSVQASIAAIEQAHRQPAAERA